MSEYDKHAWITTIDEVHNRKEHAHKLKEAFHVGRKRLTNAHPEKIVSTGAAKIAKLKEKDLLQSSSAAIEAAVSKALLSLNEITVDRGMYSVRTENALKRLRSRGYNVENLDQIRKLSLATVEYGLYSQKSFDTKLQALSAELLLLLQL